MDWKQVSEQIGKFAPVLGGVLGGPGGAALGGLVASALGVGNNPGEVAAAITGNADAMVKLREMETQQRTRLEEIASTQTIELAKAEVADRDSARRMQEATRSNMPAILTIMLSLQVSAIVAAIFWKGVPKDDSGVLMLIIGAIVTAWTGATAYYLGTTFQSMVKTDMLARRGAA